VDDTRDRSAPTAIDATHVKVVFVEDLAPLRKLVTSVLAYEGIEVHAAGSLAEGLALLERGGAEVLVTDNLLPDGTGHELAARARALDPTLATLCVSGTAPSGSDFDAFVAKPFDVEELAAAIRALAARRRRA
jgi:DNA-binding response OmpR family regulator